MTPDLREALAVLLHGAEEIVRLERSAIDPEQFAAAVKIVAAAADAGAPQIDREAMAQALWEAWAVSQWPGRPKDVALAAEGSYDGLQAIIRMLADAAIAHISTCPHADAGALELRQALRSEERLLARLNRVKTERDSLVDAGARAREQAIEECIALVRSKPDGATALWVAEDLADLFSALLPPTEGRRDGE